MNYELPGNRTGPCESFGEGGLWGNEDNLASKKTFDSVQIWSVIPKSSRWPRRGRTVS